MFCADASKRKYITEEINKIGKGQITAKVFSYKALCVATNNFHPDKLIGEGGFGRVYQGYLESSNQVNESTLIVSCSTLSHLSY